MGNTLGHCERPKVTIDRRRIEGGNGSINVPHAIVASPCAGPDNNREFGHVHTAHSRYQLGAVLRNAPFLGILPDHEARDVLQEDEWYLALPTQLHKVCALQGALAKEDAIVRYNPNRLSVDLCKASDQGGPVERLELGERRSIDDASNDLMDGNLLAQVGPCDAGKLLGVVQWFVKGPLGREGLGAVPVEVAYTSPRKNKGMRIVDGQVIRDTRNLAVQHATAKVFS